jgi:subtilisin family serine protease
VALQLNRNFVEDVIYGWSRSRRLLQDDPVRPDVWIAYAMNLAEPQNLLLEPLFGVRPGEVAVRLRRVLQAENILQETRPIYNQSTVAIRLTFEQLVTYVLPWTRWWCECLLEHVRAGGSMLAVTAIKNLHDDLAALYEGRKLTHHNGRVLALLRIVGLLAYAKTGGTSLAAHSSRSRSRNPGARRPRADRLLEAYSAGKDEAFLEALAEAVKLGWERLFENRLPRALPVKAKVNEDAATIFSVDRDRTAETAVQDSSLTIKADAARLLFAIKSDKITWAVVDSGIDASHPAFQLRNDESLSPNKDEQTTLENSRVIESYDFTRVRDLLCAAVESQDLDAVIKNDLPTAYRENLKRDPNRLEELHFRLKNGREIDWDILKPILQIDYQKPYDRPTNPHGTHVAGIIGANWPKRDGAPVDRDVLGICPDIRLIDMRVCRVDGTSDEFTVTSALQFIRHINSRRDYMVVHGANVSLSLKHDIANFACGRTPVCEEAERLVNSGVVVVAAAGNNGYNRFQTTRGDPYEGYCAISITDPGNAQLVITVGSTHRLEPHSYGVSFFSSRGPTGDGRLKPDLVAPGEKINAPIPDGGWGCFDGTSMAAPHVSGAAALLMARHPELIGEAQRIKQILCSTATDLGRERYFQGHGLVDVLRALQSV